jgi:hypothetical protein
MSKILDYLESHLLACALVIAAMAIGYGAWTSYQQRQVEQHVQAADQHHGAADAHHESATDATGKAQTYDQQIKDKEPAAQEAKAEVSRAKERLAKIPAPTPMPVPLVPGPDPTPTDPELVVLRARTQAQMDLLQAQERYITTLEGEKATLILSRDSWRTAAGSSAAEAKERASEAVQLRAALAAREGLERAAYWRGFLHGSMTGGAAGAAGTVYLGRR